MPCNVVLCHASLATLHVPCCGDELVATVYCAGACDALHIRNTPKTPVNSHSLIPQIKEYDLLEFHGEFHVKKIDSRIAYLMLVMTIEYSTGPAQSNTILSVVIV